MPPDADVTRVLAQQFCQQSTNPEFREIGSSPTQRVTRSGYRWRATGENLASGIMTPEALVAGWLGSPEHCANLMDPVFSEMGVGFGVNPRDARGVYWVLELGRPR